ncbi:MAG: hypothetical protein ABSH06_04900 [Thermodesulfobacteriota bacterium]
MNYAVLHYCFFALIAKKGYLVAQILNIVVTVLKKLNPANTLRKERSVVPEKIEDQE